MKSQTIKQDCDILTGNVYCDISDHLPNFIKIITRQTLFDKNKRPLIRIYGQKNKDNFNTLLNLASWDDFYSTSDPDQALTILYKIYNEVFEKSFPLVKLSLQRAKDKKWITEGLKTSIKHNNKLFSKFLLKPTLENKSCFTQYKKYSD